MNQFKCAMLPPFALASANESSWSSTFETLLPISLACAVTAGVMYPVDVVRALKMASAAGPNITIQEFIKHHGIKGVLTQGIVPEVTRATWMRILKFFFFPITFEKMWGKPTGKGTPMEKALAGAIAVIPEVATITTLELAKIGLQLDSQKKYNNSTTKLVSEVYRYKGWTGLMSGWQGVQMRQMLWTGTYFATLDSFKNLCSKAFPQPIEKGSTNENIINFTAGFFAGVAGAAMNTPVDVIRTNIQKQALAGLTDPSRSALRDAIDFSRIYSVGKDIVGQKGLPTLYNGFGFKALHMGGSGACVALLIPVFAKMLGINKTLM